MGSYDAVLEMPAEEALTFLDEVLNEREVESYKHALLIWASRTANASSEDAEACMPQKPDCLLNPDGWD